MLEKNQIMAEMIGIILGDGRLRWDTNNRHYQLDIILNYVDEREYVVYVKNYLTSLFKTIPKISRQKNEDGTIGKGIYLTIYDKKLVENLLLLGLKSGNKVINQVSVPLWILKKKEYIISCLKGLFDTDGSLFPVIKEDSIKLNFKNASLPLVKDFKQMCESLEIKTSKISSYEERSKKTNELSITYIVQIQAKDQVKKFIETINPMKWFHRKDKMLKILNKPFEYKMNIYSKDDVEHWILLYEQLKSFNAVRNYLKSRNLPIPKSETIRLRIKTYFGEEYKDWLKKIKNNN